MHILVIIFSILAIANQGYNYITQVKQEQQGLCPIELFIIQTKQRHMRIISLLCLSAPVQAAAWTSMVGGATVTKPPIDSATDTSHVGEPLSMQGSLNKVRDAPLLQDLEKLSSVLGEIVQQEDASIHDLYQTFRQLGLDRANGDTEALPKMIQKAQQLSAPEALGVMRTFSIMLNLVNSAEVHHRNRMTRQHDSALGNVTAGPLPLSDDSMRLTMEYLLNKGVSPKDIMQQLAKQKVEIVLTAHPTQGTTERYWNGVRLSTSGKRVSNRCFLSFLQSSARVCCANIARSVNA